MFQVVIDELWQVLHHRHYGRFVTKLMAIDDQNTIAEIKKVLPEMISKIDVMSEVKTDLKQLLFDKLRKKFGVNIDGGFSSMNR